MNTQPLTRSERIGSLQQHHAERRIIRSAWHKTDKTGRELACLLGALGKDIDSADKCPADVMPAWLAHLTPGLGDNTSTARWPEHIARYVALAQRWHILDAAAWSRAHSRTMIAALTIAAKHDKHNVVLPVINLYQRRLNADEPTTDEWRAAAEAAAWRAATAAAAAEAAAWLAATAVLATAAALAALAAEAAWRAATAAALAVERRAAWDTITDALLTAIETECTSAEVVKS